MKLIFCPECYDLRKLGSEKTTCSCGASSGKYINEIDAVISGKAISVGIENYSFRKAVIHRNQNAPMGCEFKAFTIPNKCDTIKKVKKI